MGRNMLSGEERMKHLLKGHQHLYDEIKDIPVYAKHRSTLRPWDQSLPTLAEQEANKRQIWFTKPPKFWQIVGMLCVTIVMYQLVALLPVYVNWKHVSNTWRDIEKPAIIYHRASVLMGGWIVTHIGTGLSLWFIWLTEGFSKHQLALIPFFLFTVIESAWLDIAFYTYHLDWVQLAFIFLIVLTILAQLILWIDGVEIASLFLIPQLAAYLTILVYVNAFIDKFGNEWYIETL